MAKPMPNRASRPSNRRVMSSSIGGVIQPQASWKLRILARELNIAGPLLNVQGKPLAMLLRGGGSSTRLRVLMDQLLNLPPELADGLAHRAIYDSTEAQRLLGPLGLHAPHVEQYVGPMLDYARRRLL